MILEPITRTGWKALPPRWTTRQKRPVDHIFIHHGATLLGDHTETGEARLIRSYQKHHYRKTPPWADIAYNFLVGVESGRVYTGRGWRNRPGATRRWNRRSYAICIVGDTTLQQISQQAIDSMRALIAQGVTRGHVVPDFTIRGHRDVKATACPGDTAYAALEQMRPTTRQAPAPKVIAPPLSKMLRLRRPRMRGPLVRWVQAKVATAVDGVYGPDTCTGVKNWQAEHGLTADGIVGPATHRAMFRGG